MSPALLLLLLVAGLLALLPVWRLHRAGWPPRWLLVAWVVLAVGAFVAVRFPGPFRFLVPILVLAYVAPFVAGPERLTRVLRGPREPGVIIDVTPRPLPGLRPPEPPRDGEAGEDGEPRGDDPAGVTGRIALHGGGEYVAGDERAMDALVAAAVEAARARGSAGPVRVVVVPAAAARQHPGLAGAHGERAFRAAAGRADAALEVEVALVVDPGSAASPALAARLAAADLVHLPGGDPDVIPALFPASAAWRAIEDAWRRGACLAGASAGAMALCDRCWTPRGAVAGLGLVPGWAVLPHFGPGRPAAWGDAFGSGASRPAFLGLEERTLVIGRPGGPWRVAGAGRAHLVPPGADAPTASAADGEALPG